GYALGIGGLLARREITHRGSRRKADQHVRPPMYVDEGARCVLCQQDLDAAAVERLQAFEEYVADTLSKNLKAAEAAIGKEVKQIVQAIDAGLSNGTLLDVLDALEGVDAE